MKHTTHFILNCYIYFISITSISFAQPVILNCPPNVTWKACQTQTEIDSAFENWIKQANFSGCTGTLSNNSNAAPSFCGGSATVAFTLMNDCEPPKTCSATATVTAATPLILSCPTTASYPACLSQEEINIFFEQWLNSAKLNGGCNTILSNDAKKTPDHCGGSILVNFTAKSDCEPSKNCSAIFTVTTAPPVTITCPLNKTFPDCKSKEYIDQEFETWLKTCTASGGCNTEITNDAVKSIDHCGGLITVTFTAKSDCSPAVSCNASASVTLATPLVFLCPLPLSVDICNPHGDANSKVRKWLESYTLSGGCNASASSDFFSINDPCGNFKNVVFTATSDCEPTKKCSSTIYIKSAEALRLDCPNNVTIPNGKSQEEINKLFDNWKNSFTHEGGCETIGKIINPTNPPSVCTGGSVSLTYAAESLCEGTKTCTSTFSVIGNKPEHLLLTEVVLTPSAGEYIEIYNPNCETVHLDHYYLTDNKEYASLPSDTPNVVTADFIVQFPFGTFIEPGQVMTIALNGSEFDSIYNKKANLEIKSTDPLVNDMLGVNVDANASLTNAGESIILFYWDGLSDLVSDVDMINAGIPSLNNKVDRKLIGIDEIDGPDADSLKSSYKTDQLSMPFQNAAPGLGFSTKRILVEGNHEIHSGIGNGIFGDDETSENIGITWDSAQIFTAPDPGEFKTINTKTKSAVTDEVDVMLYPNPCSDKLFIAAPNHSGQIISIKVYSDLGECVLSKWHNHEIYTHTLSEGMYLVEIKVQGVKHKIMKKFIKI